MSPYPNLRSIRIACSVVALTIALLVSYVFMISMGLTVVDAKQIITFDQTYPIYLNQQAFQSAPRTPQAAWFIVNSDSLASIMSHSTKGYSTQDFSPMIPDDYRETVLFDAAFILVSTLGIFVLTFVGSSKTLDKLLGPSVGRSFYRQGIESVGDPAAPYREKCSSLERSLSEAKKQINDLGDQLTIYLQKRGPIKIVPVSQKDLEACRRLGLSPEDYFAKKKTRTTVFTSDDDEDHSEGRGRELDMTRF